MSANWRTEQLHEIAGKFVGAAGEVGNHGLRVVPVDELNEDAIVSQLQGCVDQSYDELTDELDSYPEIDELRDGVIGTANQFLQRENVRVLMLAKLSKTVWAKEEFRKLAMTAAGALTDEQRSVCSSDAPLYIQWVELLAEQFSEPEDLYSSVIQNAFVKSAELCEEFAQIGSPGELPATEEPPERKGVDQAVSQLTSWRDITDALEMPHGEKDKIKRLNETYDGPIPTPKKGSQPIVKRSDLIEWWNRLDSMQQELANQASGKRLSGEATHNYGKTGTVAPEIHGSVKSRRKDKKR